MKISFNKKGNKIHIKKSNKGKFTDYCGGKVTDECILKAKHSSNSKLRKRATFAENARSWKHAKGGKFTLEKIINFLGKNKSNSDLGIFNPSLMEYVKYLLSLGVDMSKSLLYIINNNNWEEFISIFKTYNLPIVKTKYEDNIPYWEYFDIENIDESIDNITLLMQGYKQYLYENLNKC